jgi:hypothetical protein
MRRPICIAALIAVTLSLSSFSSYAQTDKALTDCRMKALDAVGPKPSQGQPMSTAEWERNRAWEYQWSPYVDDCMTVAGYRMTEECTLKGSFCCDSTFRTRSDCYIARPWSLSSLTSYEKKWTELVNCRVKAVDEVGPSPPPCLMDTAEVDYPACKERSANKIRAWERRWSPYVDDCMRAVGYRFKGECKRWGYESIVRHGNPDDCFD